ncbi:MAG TPA: hypothetical protein VFD92_22705 [Candidatus Binatia bacterium]|nr:hypothetical protein [Candidatus Binatia bacterium]
MTEHTNTQSGQDCKPQANPAPQPHGPGDCKDLTEPTPPELTTDKCPPPDSCCNCPPPPTTTPDCLEKLITSQAELEAKGEKAKEFRKDLEDFLAKAKKAADDYTRKWYDDEVDKWEKLDRDISELLRTVVCTVPCWRCIIECYVCPLINDVIYAERRLYDDGEFYDTVHDLYDLRYWYGRQRDAKQRQADRIAKVLAAWEKPAQTIDKAIADNRTLYESAKKSLGTDPSKTVYDVFFKLIPMHLAIAPPASRSTTVIDKKYTEFCPCDEGEPDDCCGPDVGEPSVRQRLVGPQPFLVDPNDYFALICCLVEKRYRPVKDALADATARYQSVDDEITRNLNLIKDRLDPKSFEKAAKGAIPSVVDCCGDVLRKTESKPTQQAD